MNLFAERPRNQDAVIAVVVLIFAVVALTMELGERGSTASAEAYVVAGGAAATLLLRRRHPLAVLGVVVVANVLVAWQSSNDVALAPAAAVALYTVARAGERVASLVIAGSTALALAFAVHVQDTDALLPEFAGELVQMLLPIAVGDAARSRAERVRDLIESEANARVQAERLRIARDLHDVVAHGLSTIAIQSGVAAHLLDRDPSQAKEALEVINETGKSSLEELRSMVGVLRSTDDIPLRPTPTDPNDLTDLISGASHAGITLTVTTAGQFPERVGDSCVVAMHRIAQEALTNVARHAGPVPTELSIHHHTDEVRLSITNRPGLEEATDVPSTGVGINGMVERAEALGGTLRASATPVGGFEVVAIIPYHQRLD